MDYEEDNRENTEFNEMIVLMNLKRKEFLYGDLIPELQKRLQFLKDRYPHDVQDAQKIANETYAPNDFSAYTHRNTY